MPEYQYSAQDIDADAKGMITEADMSPKMTVETCRAIKGMKVNKAKEYLKKVIKQEEFVPLTKHNKKQPHRKGGQPGKYPEKVCKKILKLIENIENNAEQKNIDPEELKIVHTAAHKSRALKRVFPKGTRRKNRKKEQVNVEMMAKRV